MCKENASCITINCGCCRNGGGIVPTEPKDEQWTLIKTINHAVESHSEEIDFRAYKEIRIVAKDSNRIFCNTLSTDLLSDSTLRFSVGGVYCIQGIGLGCYVDLTSSSIAFTEYSIASDSVLLAGTFYIYGK